MQSERDNRGIRLLILKFGANGMSGQCQPTGKEAGNHCTEGWEGPRAGLDGPSGFKSESSRP